MNKLSAPKDITPKNLITQCCPEQNFSSSVSSSITKTNTTKAYVTESFLPASYFLLMLLALGNFPHIMQSVGVNAVSTTVLSMGLWAINSIIFCVVSFMYYSEGDAPLKSLFANLRIVSLSCYPTLFWWALYHHENNIQPFEWSVVFGISASLFLLFSGFVLKLTQKQLITSYLFLASALLTYSGIIQAATGNTFLSGFLLSSGVISLMAFALQTQTMFKLKCQHVEVLLMLSLIILWLGMSLI